MPVCAVRGMRHVQEVGAAGGREGVAAVRRDEAGERGADALPLIGRDVLTVPLADTSDDVGDGGGHRGQAAAAAGESERARCRVLEGLVQPQQREIIRAMCTVRLRLDARQRRERAEPLVAARGEIAPWAAVILRRVVTCAAWRSSQHGGRGAAGTECSAAEGARADSM